MKNESKKIIAGAIILVLAVAIFTNVNINNLFNVKMQATTDTSWDLWQTQNLPDGNKGSSSATLFRNQFTDAAQKEICIDADIGTIWLNDKEGTARSQQIVFKATMEAYLRSSSEAVINAPNGNFLGSGGGEAGKRSQYECNGLGGYYFEVYLNNALVYTMGKGGAGVVPLPASEGKILIERGPTDSAKLSNQEGYKWNGGNYGGIDPRYTNNEKGWHLPYSGKQSCGKSSGGWYANVANRQWMTASSASSGVWQKVWTDSVQMYVLGPQTGTLTIKLFTDYAYRADGSENWNTWGGWWYHAGPYQIATDTINLKSGKGSVEIVSANPVQKTDNPDLYKDTGSKTNPSTPSTMPSGGTAPETYPERIFQEGETVNLAVTTGYSGALTSGGTPIGWSLAVWDAKGNMVDINPSDTSSMVLSVPNNVNRQAYSFTVPKGSFIGGMLNEWTIMLINGFCENGIAYAFVVDTKEKLPGRATVLTDKPSYKSGDVVTVTMSAQATTASGPITSFRLEARYDDARTGTVRLTQSGISAWASGSTYKATYQFVENSQNRNLYLIANAVAGAYPGPTSLPLQISTTPKFINYKVNIMVLDINGKSPVSAALITIGGTSGASSKASGADGIASYFLEKGSYPIKISKSGYDDYTDILYVSGDMLETTQKYYIRAQTPSDGGGGDDGGENETPVTSVYAINVKVTNSITTNGVPGCQVVLGDFVKWADSTGLAIFDGSEKIPEGEQLLTVNDDLYEQYSQTISITSAITINVQLIPKEEIPSNESNELPVVIVDVPVIVTDTSEVPINGANVELSAADLSKSYTGITDSTGNAQISVPEGDYNVVVTKTGYYTGYGICIALTGMDTVQIKLLTESEATNETNINAPIQIIIYCTDTATKKAVSDVSVAIGTDTKKTDSRGNAQFYLARGTYTVKITRAGYVDKTQDVTVSKSQIFNIKLENAGKKKAPGFELLMFIAALGIALVLMKRKKRGGENMKLFENDKAFVLICVVGCIIMLVIGLIFLWFFMQNAMSFGVGCLTMVIPVVILVILAILAKKYLFGSKGGEKK